jgi:hypothetical protein
MRVINTQFPKGWRNRISEVGKGSNNIEWGKWDKWEAGGWV